MVKIMLFLNRQPHLSNEALDQHLRDTHTPLVQQLPGLRRLVLNRVQADPSGPPATWDIIAEDWFDSLEAMQAALGSPAGQAVNADAATFLDMNTFQVLVVQEEEVPLRPAG